jgi:hypothetical protein
MFIIISFVLSPWKSLSQTILIFEDFESGDFENKGWYDGFADQRTTDEHKNGSYSYRGHYAQGAKTSGAGRHLFPPTDKVYLSYWVKYSTNWVGSGVAYHPHEWNILTTEDGIYQGPADTYLTTYIEQNAGKPLLGLQDSKNVDPNCILLNNDSFVGCNGDFDSYPFTENRSSCSCNGLTGFIDTRDCFYSPGNTHGYYSSKSWHADSVYFRNTPGPYYKNDWHFIEAYFELNSIVEGIGIPDGKIRYWYDGRLLISSDSILFRTGAHPDMKFNQLFYGPYIGVGSPVDQTWWIDDMTVADGLPLTLTEEINKIDSAISIYPNPSSGQLTIDFKENSKINFFEIIDLYGNIVFQQTDNLNPKHLNLELPKGIYFLRMLNHHNHYSTRKIIIQ